MAHSPDTPTQRAADILAKRLYDAGCRYAFGMPGGEVLTLIDALEAAGITFVLTKHENAAGFMGEGVHHMDRAPAILVATIGPGAVNGINVVANADQDRVPLIVLTGCVDADEAQTYTHQVLDHEAVFKPITKGTYRLTAQSADIIADKAVNLSTSGRAGPVHIDVPIDVADTAVAVALPRRNPLPAKNIPMQSEQLVIAQKWLQEARKPVMIVGLDALADDAGAAIVEFVETYSVPFVTTYKAKGIIPETHPLCLGGGGLSPKADGILVPFIKQADLVICAGYDPIEMRTGWRDIWSVQDTRVIDISACENTHYMHQAGLNFVSDTGASLVAISVGVDAAETWANGQITDVKRALAEAFPQGDTWGAAGVIAQCRSSFPDDTIATVDSGAHRILLSQMWSCAAPRTLLQSSGLCTMGVAVPLAMGVSVAKPDTPVVSFSGDAGMLMVAGELSTAAERSLRTVFVVFVDASLALIELKQRGRQLQNIGVDFAKHDFAAIGRAFGGKGVDVFDREGLAKAIDTALAADTFTVIAAHIDRQSYDGRI